MLIGDFTRFYVESPSISLQAYVSDVFHQKPDFVLTAKQEKSEQKLNI